jgi:hypothetical protein
MRCGMRRCAAEGEGDARTWLCRSGRSVGRLMVIPQSQAGMKKRTQGKTYCETRRCETLGMTLALGNGVSVGRNTTRR